MGGVTARQIQVWKRRTPMPMKQKSMLPMMLRMNHLLLTQELGAQRLSALMWSGSQARKRKLISKRWPSRLQKGEHGRRVAKTKEGKAERGVKAENLGKTRMAGKGGRAAKMERVSRARRVGNTGKSE